MVTIGMIQVESMCDRLGYFDTKFVFPATFYCNSQCHCKFGLVLRMLCILLGPFPILMIAQAMVKGIGNEDFGLLQSNSFRAFPCVTVIDPLDFD